MGAGLGVLYTVIEGWPVILGILGAGIGAVAGWAFTQRTPEGTPRALRDYARENRLGRERNPLPAVTPLLLQPWGRTDAHVFGAHPSGFNGRIGVFNFVRPARMYLNVTMQLITRGWWSPSDGNRMLVALTQLPESRRTLPVLLCERKYGGAILDSVEETARGLKRVRLESVELDRRYEVFTHPLQEPVWIRRLFSPSFVVWMTEELTQELSFEIFDGHLCVASPVKDEEKLSVEEVERMSKLAHTLTERVRTELTETRLARPPALG
ncbi:MAG: hypothetical protein M3331_06655 [Actinomycetota bacterium]|nr:hypothetical protein [Actinomycetota bacterium]